MSIELAGGADALIHRIQSAPREIVFVLGSALTMPIPKGSPGVPPVDGMVEGIRQKLPDNLRKKLDTELSKSKNKYQDAFQFLFRSAGPDNTHNYVRDAVLQARVRGAAEPDWSKTNEAEYLEGHALEDWYLNAGTHALGQLLAVFPEQAGRTVLTTNFDPLVEVAVRRAGGHAYASVLTEDGHLDQARGRGTHVVHLHGYWHGKSLHLPDQLRQKRPNLKGSLKQLLKKCTVVVLGYGGWDDVFVEALKSGAQDREGEMDLLWAFFEGDAALIESKYASVHKHLKDMLKGYRAQYYGGINLHELLPRLLHEHLRRQRVPLSMGTMPVEPVLGHYVGRRRARRDVWDCLEKAQAVELLGAEKTGKSALLRWAERAALGQGKKTALISGASLKERSPAALVQAAAAQVGKLYEVNRILYETSACPDMARALTALEALEPISLFVDDADRLTEAGHAFEPGFFDTLRAKGEKKLVHWVSSSKKPLMTCLGWTPSTSKFLNDSKKYWCGALETDEAREWLEGRGMRKMQVQERVMGSGSGWVVLMEQAVRMEEAGEKVGDGALEAWARPLFEQWWGHLDEKARGCLMEVERGKVRSEDGRWDTAEGLVDKGLLGGGEGGVFRGIGGAWGEFVRRRRG